MKAHKWCLLVFGWVTVLFSSVVHAETLHFATIDYCPFTCNPDKESGKEGFMTDVLRKALEEAGYALRVEMHPYVRAVREVRDGKYDGIVVVGKDYAPDLVYPDMPTVVQRVVFLTATDTSWNYTGVESLRNAKVGIVRGFHYVDPDLIAYLEHNQTDPTKVLVMHGENTTERGVSMLQTNRITTFLEGEYSARYVLRKMGILDSIRVAGFTRNAFEDYTGFSPKNPDASRFARILSNKIQELKQSGRLADILSRYGITPVVAN
ncbi:MAG: transporter substrate-binding domain-containing protein [Ketobacteraceae bacterium]|nr:transporter substrate-binding domain-containing protein [Ketobacteraceae bacterium]